MERARPAPVRTLLGVADQCATEREPPSGVHLRRAGQVLDQRYLIEDLFGEGSVGLVYRATDLHLQRPVAIKVLREEYAHGEILERFFREARVLSRLAHPNVVSVNDFGLAPPPGGRKRATSEGQGTPYLVLELLEGRMLETEVDKGALSVTRSLAIARQLLGALVYAHGLGVVHRDLKAGNLWLTDSVGRPDHLKVLDFGLARIVSPTGEPGEEGFTRRGFVYGSPEYLSPEQAAGDVADERSDLYSTGVVLFEMLTGRLPFISPNPTVVMQRHMLARPPRVREIAPELPEAIDEIVAKALRKPRAQRWQTALEMLAAVEEAESLLAPPRRSSVPPAPPSEPRLPLVAPVTAAQSFPWWWLAATVVATAAATTALVLVS